jgi:hypothetical protein
MVYFIIQVGAASDLDTIAWTLFSSLQAQAQVQGPRQQTTLSSYTIHASAFNVLSPRHVTAQIIYYVPFAVYKSAVPRKSTPLQQQNNHIPSNSRKEKKLRHIYLTRMTFGTDRRGTSKTRPEYKRL